MNNKNYKLETKLGIMKMKTCDQLLSITVNVNEQKIETAELWFNRKILMIPWKGELSNLRSLGRVGKKETD